MLLNFHSKSRYLFLFCLLLVFACGKESVDLPFTTERLSTNLNLNSIAFTSPDEGYIVGGKTWTNGIVAHTIDGGDSWTVDSLADKELFDLHISPDKVSRTVGIDGYIFSNTTSGNDWNFHRYNVWDIHRGIAVNDNNQEVIVGGQAFHTGHIMRLNAMNQIDTVIRLEHELAAVEFVNNNRVIAAGYGVILISEDAGLNWQFLPVEGDFFVDIHFIDDQFGFIVGNFGTILKTTNGGSDWKEVEKGGNVISSNQNMTAIHFFNNSLGFVVGRSGLFWRTDNGGEDWKEVAGIPDIDLKDVFIYEEKGYAVGANGQLIRFSVQ